MTNVPPPPPGQPPQQPWGQQQPYPQQPQPQPQPQQPYPQQPVTQAAAPGYGQPQAAAPAEPKGIGGVFRDASTLAATGLIAAEIFAIFAGLIGFIASYDIDRLDEFKQRLMRLTETVDVGDVAILGLAVALLLLTPDPPGGIRRSVLLAAASVVTAVVTVYGLIRALTILTLDDPFLIKFAGFVATAGVAVAAFTVAFYAASESFMKRRVNR